MLKRIFQGSQKPDAALVFLEEFSPRGAWVLVAKGKRKIHAATFVPQTRGDTPAWLTKRLAEGCELRLLTAEPARAILRAPVREDISGTRHFGIEVPGEARAALDAFKPAPFLLAATENGFAALWRLMAPIAPEMGEKLGERIAARLGGRNLGLSFPLPGTGAARLLHLHKDRLCLPTDFATVAPRTIAEEAGTRPAFKAAANIKPEAIRWLWPGVVPLGALTLLAGAPGMGKSQIACAVAATLTSGGTWPDGSRCEPGSAIVCESEDDPASVIRPRIEAAGGDVANVAFGPVLDLAQELDALVAQAEAMAAPARLLVLSPIGSFFGPSSHDDVTMRARLAPLFAWAAAKGVAVLGLTHPPKTGSADVFSGSDTFRKAARAAWRVEIDATDDEPIVKRKRRLMLSAKANICPDDFRLAYRIEGATTPHGIETSRVVWLPDAWAEDTPAPETHSEPAAAKPAKRVANLPAKLDPVIWLRARLADGKPHPCKAVREEAKAAGISTGRLYRAVVKLGVLNEGAGGRGGKRWRLP